MNSGGDPAEQFRLAGSHAGRILKGESQPISVQDSTTLELIINLKTAKRRRSIPLALLGRADEARPVTA
jgi:hypothetical protein